MIHNLVLFTKLLRAPRSQYKSVTTRFAAPAHTNEAICDPHRNIHSETNTRFVRFVFHQTCLSPQLCLHHRIIVSAQATPPHHTTPHHTTPQGGGTHTHGGWRGEGSALNPEPYIHTYYIANRVLTWAGPGPCARPRGCPGPVPCPKCALPNHALGVP